jgi:hypothetical protein
VLETRIIKPNQLILSTKHFIQQTKEALKTEVVTPICDGEIELEKMQLNRIEAILEDFKLWKDFRDKMQMPKTT